MSKWNLIFDVARCNSCNNCLMATKDEYLGNRFEGYSEPAPKLGNLWLTLQRHERGEAPMIDVSHYVTTCQQCDNAPCMNDQTKDVISKRPDGIVVIDPKKAKGRKDLVDTCPYGQIFWNEDIGIAQKYSFDAHLLDSGWKEPRAVQACPTLALTVAKLDDAAMAEKVKAENLVALRPELNTKPRVWYKNFDKVTHAFLGGSLVRKREGLEDCVVGATVRLMRDGKLVQERSSDSFGDFKFEPLEGRGEEYALQVLGADKAVIAEIKVALIESRYIGVIEI